MMCELEVIIYQPPRSYIDYVCHICIYIYLHVTRQCIGSICDVFFRPLGPLKTKGIPDVHRSSPTEAEVSFFAPKGALCSERDDYTK